MSKERNNRLTHPRMSEHASSVDSSAHLLAGRHCWRPIPRIGDAEPPPEGLQSVVDGLWYVDGSGGSAGGLVSSSLVWLLDRGENPAPDLPAPFAAPGGLTAPVSSHTSVDRPGEQKTLLGGDSELPPFSYSSARRSVPAHQNVPLPLQYPPIIPSQLALSCPR